MTDTAFAIEVLLLRWGENHSSGRTVTFKLHDDEGEHHPFRGLKCGPANGQRFRLTFEPIADDESTTAQEVQASRPPNETPDPVSAGGRKSWHELTPAQQAGIRCNDPEFWKFLTSLSDVVIHSEPAAAGFVREWCNVESRSEFIPKSAAAASWRGLDEEFRDWWRRQEPTLPRCKFLVSHERKCFLCHETGILCQDEIASLRPSEGTL